MSSFSSYFIYTRSFYKKLFLAFFRFPRNKLLRRKWQIAMKRLKFGSKDILWEPKTTDCVCSLHFNVNDFIETGKRRRVKENAVPSFRPHESTSSAIELYSLENPPSVPRPPLQRSLTDENAALRVRLQTQHDKFRNARKRENRLRMTVRDTMEQLREEKLKSAIYRGQLKCYGGEGWRHLLKSRQRHFSSFFWGGGG